MTHEEHSALVDIFTGKPWECRPRLGEFIKTIKPKEEVTVVTETHTVLKFDKNSQNVPNIEEDPKHPLELKFGPLAGGLQPDYPEYTGPVNFEPE